MKEISVTGIQEKRKRRRRYFILGSALFTVFLMLIGTGWFFLKSPAFRLRTIAFEGNATIPNRDISDLFSARMFTGKWGWLRAFLGQGNILAWPGQLSAADLAFIPAVKNAIVAKNYEARSITIMTEERHPAGIWCTMNTVDAGSASSSTSPTCAWFDDGGIIFKKAISATGGLILTVHDYSNRNLGLGSTVFPAELLPNAFSVFAVIQKSGVNVKEIRLNDVSLEEMELDTYDGPKLYFSLRFPADNDSAAIENFTSKPGFGKLQYLDFRVENRVYYK